MTRVRRFLCPVVFLLGGCQVGCGRVGDAPESELPPPASWAPAVLADGKLTTTYSAGSRIRDTSGKGGHGESSNFPRDLAGRRWGEAGAVSLVASPNEPADYRGHRGFALRLVNRTGESVSFSACDSALCIVREARAADGTWREIESQPRSWCGNSYHRVFLEPGRYWVFPAREYTGPIQTRMRFRVHPAVDRPAVTSNEFDGRVTPGQLGERG